MQEIDDTIELVKLCADEMFARIDEQVVKFKKVVADRAIVKSSERTKMDAELLRRHQELIWLICDTITRLESITQSPQCDSIIKKLELIHDDLKSTMNSSFDAPQYIKFNVVL